MSTLDTVGVQNLGHFRQYSSKGLELELGILRDPQENNQMSPKTHRLPQNNLSFLCKRCKG